MRRPLVAFLLLLAVAGTGLVTFQLLGRGESDRREREAGSFGDETGTIETAAPPVETTELPAGKAVSGEWSVTGRVTDREGRPIAGAVVRAISKGALFRAIADGDGAYEHAFDYPVCDFDVTAAGFLPLIGTVNGRSNGLQQLVFDGKGPWTRDFVLERAATLTGSVRDEYGTPVAGARVYVVSPEYALVDRVTVGNVVTTDRGGAFMFPGLGAGTYDVGARAGGLMPGLVRDVVVPERGAVACDVVLKRGRKIVVEVASRPPDRQVLLVAADSRLRDKLLPPGGVSVLRDALVGREWIDFPVVTSVSGELAGVGPGAVDVEAYVLLEDGGVDPSYLLEDGLSRLRDTTDEQLTLTLVPGILIEINVRDAVTAAALEPHVLRRSEGASREQEMTKFFENWYWAPLDARRHSLRFVLDGYQEARLDLPGLQAGATVGNRPAHGHPFDVAMVPTAEGETGSLYVVFEPALTGRVALVGRDTDGRQTWVRHLDHPDAKGRWEATAIPVGQYSVAVLATGKIPVVVPNVNVQRNFEDTLRVVLNEGGGLAFKVTDRDGKVLDEVHLLLKDGNDTQIDIHIMTEVSEGRAFLSINYLPSAATAKADSGLAPGNYTLSAYRKGYEIATTSFAIRATEVADVELTLDRE